jgi:hypothetical protein
MSDRFGATSYCCVPEHVIDCVNPNVAQIFVENLVSTKPTKKHLLTIILLSYFSWNVHVFVIQ